MGLGYGDFYHNGIKVEDADTFDKLSGGRIRLEGVNAPETSHPELGIRPQFGGAEAARFVENELATKDYAIAPRAGSGEDKYGRGIAPLAPKGGGRDLSSALIQEGYAAPFMTDDPQREKDRIISNKRYESDYQGGFYPELRNAPVVEYPQQPERALPTPHRGLWDTATSSFVRGLDTSQKMGYGFLENLGADPAWVKKHTDEQDREIAQNQAEIGLASNVHGLGDAVKYGVEKVWEQGANIGMSMLGAAALTAVAAATPELALGGAAAGIMGAGAEVLGALGTVQKIAQAARVAKYAKWGAGLASMPMNVGETQLNADEANAKEGGTHIANWQASLVGEAKAAVDVWGLGKAFGLLGDILKGPVKGAVASVIGRTALAGGLMEGIPETAQDVMDQSLLIAHGKQEGYQGASMLESFLAGTLTGTAVTGAGAAAAMALAPSTETAATGGDVAGDNLAGGADAADGMSVAAKAGQTGGAASVKPPETGTRGGITKFFDGMDVNPAVIDKMQAAMDRQMQDTPNSNPEDIAKAVGKAMAKDYMAETDPDKVVQFVTAARELSKTPGMEADILVPASEVVANVFSGAVLAHHTDGMSLGETLSHVMPPVTGAKAAATSVPGQALGASSGVTSNIMTGPPLDVAGASRGVEGVPDSIVHGDAPASTLTTNQEVPTQYTGLSDRQLGAAAQAGDQDAIAEQARRAGIAGGNSDMLKNQASAAMPLPLGTTATPEALNVADYTSAPVAQPEALSTEPSVLASKEPRTEAFRAKQAATGFAKGVDFRHFSEYQSHISDPPENEYLLADGTFVGAHDYRINSVGTRGDIDGIKLWDKDRVVRAKDIVGFRKEGGTAWYSDYNLRGDEPVLTALPQKEAKVSSKELARKKREQEYEAKQVAEFAEIRARLAKERDARETAAGPDAEAGYEVAQPGTTYEERSAAAAAAKVKARALPQTQLAFNLEPMKGAGTGHFTLEAAPGATEGLLHVNPDVEATSAVLKFFPEARATSGPVGNLAPVKVKVQDGKPVAFDLPGISEGPNLAAASKLLEKADDRMAELDDPESHAMYDKAMGAVNAEVRKLHGYLGKYASLLPERVESLRAKIDNYFAEPPPADTGDYYAEAFMDEAADIAKEHEALKAEMPDMSEAYHIDLGTIGKDAKQPDFDAIEKVAKTGAPITMPVARQVTQQDRITRTDLKANPDKVYLFGDNLIQRGMGGQAAEMRGEPNAVGIPTKKLPSMSGDAFFSDDDYSANVKAIDASFAKIPAGKEVVMPSAGLGTGLARLDTLAPKTFAYLQSKIKALSTKHPGYTAVEAYLKGEGYTESEGAWTKPEAAQAKDAEIKALRAKAKPALVELVNRWARYLGVEAPRISDELPSSLGRDYKPYGQYINGADGKAEIRFSDEAARHFGAKGAKFTAMERVQFIEAFAHEFGHHVIMRMYGNASVELQGKIFDDYRAFLARTEGMSPDERRAEKEPLAITKKREAVGHTGKGEGHSKFMAEWLADNVARRIMQQEYLGDLAPETEGFIKEAAAKIRDFYNHFKAEVGKYAAAPSIEKFLDGLVESASIKSEAPSTKIGTYKGITEAQRTEHRVEVEAEFQETRKAALTAQEQIKANADGIVARIDAASGGKLGKHKLNQISKWMQEHPVSTPEKPGIGAYSPRDRSATPESMQDERSAEHVAKMFIEAFPELSIGSHDYLVGMFTSPRGSVQESRTDEETGEETDVGDVQGMTEKAPSTVWYGQGQESVDDISKVHTYRSSVHPDAIAETAKRGMEPVDGRVPSESAWKRLDDINQSMTDSVAKLVPVRGGFAIEVTPADTTTGEMSDAQFRDWMKKAQGQATVRPQMKQHKQLYKVGGQQVEAESQEEAEHLAGLGVTRDQWKLMPEYKADREEFEKANDRDQAKLEVVDGKGKKHNLDGPSISVLGAKIDKTEFPDESVAHKALRNFMAGLGFVSDRLGADMSQFTKTKMVDVETVSHPEYVPGRADVTEDALPDNLVIWALPGKYITLGAAKAAAKRSAATLSELNAANKVTSAIVEIELPAGDTGTILGKTEDQKRYESQHKGLVQLWQDMKRLPAELRALITPKLKEQITHKLKEQIMLLQQPARIRGYMTHQEALVARAAGQESKEITRALDYAQYLSDAENAQSGVKWFQKQVSDWVNLQRSAKDEVAAGDVDLANITGGTGEALEREADYAIPEGETAPKEATITDATTEDVGEREAFQKIVKNAPAVELPDLTARNYSTATAEEVAQVQTALHDLGIPENVIHLDESGMPKMQRVYATAIRQTEEAIAYYEGQKALPPLTTRQAKAIIAGRMFGTDHASPEQIAQVSQEELDKFLSDRTARKAQSDKKIDALLKPLTKQLQQFKAIRATLMQLQASNVPGQYISNDLFTEAALRRPIIYVSSALTGMKRVEVLAHELGHHAQRALVDQLSLRAKNGDVEAGKIVEEVMAMGPEGFADSFVHYLAERYGKTGAPVTAITVTGRAAPEVVGKSAPIVADVRREELSAKIHNLNAQLTKAYEVEAAFAPAYQGFRNTSGAIKAEIAKAEAELYGRPEATSDFELGTAVGGAVAPRPVSSGVKALFKSIADALVKIWKALTAQKHPPAVEFLHSIARRSSNDILNSFDLYLRDNPILTGPVLPIRTEMAVQNWVGERFVGSNVRNSIKAASDSIMNGSLGVNAPHPLLKSVDAYLRSLTAPYMTLFADSQHVKAGTERHYGSTVQEDMRKIGTGDMVNKHLQPLLDRVLEAPNMFKRAFMHPTEARQINERIAKIKDVLISQEDTPVGFNKQDAKQIADIRAYQEMLHKWATETMGLQMGHQKNHFALQFDKQKMAAGIEKFHRILEGFGMSTQEAHDFYQKIVKGTGSIVDITMDTVLTSRFTSRKGRTLEAEMRVALRDFYQDDIATNLVQYTHSLVKRCVLEKHYGEVSVLGREPMDIANSMSEAVHATGKSYGIDLSALEILAFGEGLRAAKEAGDTHGAKIGNPYKAINDWITKNIVPTATKKARDTVLPGGKIVTKMEASTMQDDIRSSIMGKLNGTMSDPSSGILRYDPMGRLIRWIDVSSNANQISPTQADHIKRNVIPALMGTLGADINPTLNNVQSWIKTWLHLSMMPLALLTNLSDVAHIDIRRGKMGAGLTAMAKVSLDRKNHKDIAEFADFLGLTSRDVMQHMVADSVNDSFMSYWPKVISENFFKANLMQWWTDTTRLSALRIAPEALRDLALRKDKAALRELAELEVTPDQIKAYLSAKDKYDLAHSAVHNALSRWVDSAVVRPSASTRPYYGSNAKMQLFWMYKDFMWGTYEIVGRRLWTQIQNKEGIGKALPVLMAGASLMPLAILGYELRRAITRQKDDKDDDLGHYSWKMLDRTGMLGPFALMWSMQTEAEHRNFALMALAGPFGSKLGEIFSDREWSDLVATSTPILSTLPAYKKSVRGF